MTDREKLIALLTEAKYEGFKTCGNHIDCDDCPAFKDGSRCTEGITADYIIANGVTFAINNNVGSKTSKQKTKDILDWVQSTAEVDWWFMCCLKQELEQLVAIASGNDASGR